MKIKKEHFDIMKKSIVKFLTSRPELKEHYKKEGLSKERFAWDVLFASVDLGFVNKVLYRYLKDAHIQTALFKIIKY